MPPLHGAVGPLPKDPREAFREQRRLAAQVVREDRLGDVRLVAGVDVSAGRAEIARAGIVVLSYPQLDVVERAVAARPIDFPYVPGLLSVREIPAILDVWQRIERTPDLVLVDGQGIAHPRRLGIAAHFGLVAGLPTIGCAKSRLVGSYDEPGPRPGDRSPLRDDGETIGMVVRTKKGANPLFISVGHNVGLDTAVEWVLRLTRGYRLPEPTRWAHNVAGEQHGAAP